MQKHKWYNEIVAWASGAEIEYYAYGIWRDWNAQVGWFEDYEYRIKPQPKPEAIEDILLWLVRHRGYMDLDSYTLDVLLKNFMNDFDCKDERIVLSDTQPKPDAYLYVYQNPDLRRGVSMYKEEYKGLVYTQESYIGKIKLEVDDE